MLPQSPLRAARPPTPCHPWNLDSSFCCHREVSYKHCFSLHHAEEMPWFHRWPVTLALQKHFKCPMSTALSCCKLVHLGVFQASLNLLLKHGFQLLQALCLVLI